MHLGLGAGAVKGRPGATRDLADELTLFEISEGVIKALVAPPLLVNVIRIAEEADLISADLIPSGCSWIIARALSRSCWAVTVFGTFGVPFNGRGDQHGRFAYPRLGTP